MWCIGPITAYVIPFHVQMFEVGALPLYAVVCSLTIFIYTSKQRDPEWRRLWSSLPWPWVYFWFLATVIVDIPVVTDWALTLLPYVPNISTSENQHHYWLCHRSIHHRAHFTTICTNPSVEENYSIGFLCSSSELDSAYDLVHRLECVCGIEEG